MNVVVKSILGLGIAASVVTIHSMPSYAEQRFSCNEEQLNTTVQSHWGELPMIRWSDGSFPPPYTPLERCKEVTRRFNQFNNNGTLKYMTTGTINNSPVICVAGYEGGECLPNGLLITLKYGRDPDIALKRILDTRVWATSETISLSNKNDGLIYEVDGKVYVDVETLLNGKE